MRVRQRFGASERRACRVLGQPRTTQRRVKKVRTDETALRTDVVRLASRFGRYGYRQITNLLRIEGWRVNHKRVERIWRQEGLKVPRRQPKRGRLWLNDGSCIRLRPLHTNHVWSYDFVSTRTHDGRALKLLTVLDEYTRECVAIKVARKIRAHDVLEVLAELFARHGPPEHLRSDNVPTAESRLAVGDRDPDGAQLTRRRRSQRIRPQATSRWIASTLQQVLLSIMNTGSAWAALTVPKTA